MPDVRTPYRIPLLALAFVSLVIGVAAGLLRLGWNVPLPSTELAAFHGPLMVSGFFGTVISLERAVALAQRWAYTGPLAAGAAGLGFIFGAPPVVCESLLVVAGVVLLAGSVQVYLRQRALFTFTLALGSACWLIGNALWLAGMPIYSAIPLWAGFLVLTIAGERLELSRFLPPAPIAKRIFVVIIAAMIAALLGSIAYAKIGTSVFGAALLALALWLGRQDIARRTVRESGLTRFIAVCLLSGYAWLATAGAIMLFAGGLAPGPFSYDAALHALMLGFVFSMVFGHAPIIFPAVAKVRMPFHSTFYVPLTLLHLSLIVRLAGDAMANADWRSAGGALNALALAAFVINTIVAIARGSTTRGREIARG